MTNESSDFTQHLQGWFAGRLPGEWFDGAPTVDFDDDEILVTGALTVPELPEDAGPETRQAALQARIQGFREDTRMLRMRGIVQEFNVYRWAGRMLLDAARMRQRARLIKQVGDPDLQVNTGGGS